MNNARLINKYGEPAKINDLNVKAYFEDSKKSYYFSKSAIYSSFDVEVIHTLQEVLLDDIVVLKGENFGVLEALPVYTKGKLSYCETVTYKDDFVNDITIKKQTLSKQGCSLPKVSEVAPIETKARIKTTKPIDYLQFALQGAKVPTHLITLKYIDGVDASDLIEWGERRFEVLTIENINETNTLLAVSCIEVL